MPQTNPWYRRTLRRWSHFRTVPLRRLWILVAAAFLMFSISGFYSDLLSEGRLPYAIALMGAFYSGLDAAVWVIVVSRLTLPYVIALAFLQFFTGRITGLLAAWMTRTFALPPVAPEPGIHFAATGIMTSAILSYIFFLTFIRGEGRESLRLQNQLELAQGIQKTLVPPIQLRTACFEIYGISHPSERVGGDLVDAVLLPDGGAIAYLADIAGHGLPAGILMGMLKTATRTALLESGEREAEATLPLLLDRLNTVLPQVKEPHMYATFTGVRLGADGSVLYALAGSPPLVQWHASDRSISYTQIPQLPLGLLPAPSGFEGHRLETRPGDLLVVATDGILEVCNQASDEFGLDRLKDAIAASADAPLPDLAAGILAAARRFGAQFDDQTILIVRCL